MADVNSLNLNMEDLLDVCSRSIVAPDVIVLEASRLLTIISDKNVEEKFIVKGCEKLSLLALGFLRSGYDAFTADYADRSGSDLRIKGFSDKDELIRYCEYCVDFGEKKIGRIKTALMVQLEIENRMTKDEICNLNIRKFALKKEIARGIRDDELSSTFHESYRNLITVQDQVTDYIKLSLLVNSLKKFFKEYYKGLN